MFGDRLKQLRIDRKLNQQYLANQLRLSNKTISKYERNESEPDFETLKKIAIYFNVSIDYLLGNDNYDFDTTFKYALSKIESLPKEEQDKIGDYANFILERYRKNKKAGN